MKEFFGIDITENSLNDRPNSYAFLSRQPSPAHLSALQSAAAAVDGFQKKARLPMVFLVIYYIVYFGAVSVVIGLIRGMGNVGFAKAYENAPWVFYLGGIFLVLWGIMTLWKNRRSKQVTSGEDFQSAARRAETAAASCFASMGVPENAPRMDVLSCRYSVKNGKTKIATHGATQYTNPEVRIFAEEGVLCLADTEHCCAIPLEEIRCLRKINKAMLLPGWNKDLGPREGRYKSYKMAVDKYNRVNSKPYYALEIHHNGEDYVLHFPCYELPVVEAFTKLPITE